MGQSFKEFVLSEGELFDAIKHGFSTGMKAFRAKRQEQVKSKEPENLTKRILSAEGKELEALVKQIVDNGYTIKSGSVVKPSEVARPTDWLLECTSIKTESYYAKLSPKIYRPFSISKMKAGGAHIKR